MDANQLMNPIETSPEKNPPDTAPSKNALVREGQLLWQGVSAIPEAISHSLDSEHRQGTITTALLSAGSTLVWDCLKRDPAASATAARTLLPALIMSSAKEVMSHADGVINAMADTWYSDKNWQKNVDTVKKDIGDFGSNLVISAAAGGLAERTGRSYFDAKAIGAKSLPLLSRENIHANWDKHMAGDVVPYSLHSAEGGGLRQVDVFVPKSYSPDTATNLLIAPDSTLMGFGAAKNLKKSGMAMTNGLANTEMDPSIDYVAAFPHAKQFRVLPGVNMGAWFHEGGLVTPGGWLAPKPKFNDVDFIADVNKSMKSIFNTDKSTIAGFSGGAMLGQETASKLGADNINAAISVAGTVTGKESLAQTGQFRLFVNDLGDKTFPIDGGAGGPAKILTSLGHKNAMLSMPRSQVDYAIAPYAKTDISTSNIAEIPGVSQTNYKLADGTPIAASIELNTGAHGWPNRRTSAPEDTTMLTGINKVSKVDGLDLNGMIKNIVHGRLEQFQQ